MPSETDHTEQARAARRRAAVREARRRAFINRMLGAVAIRTMMRAIIARTMRSDSGHEPMIAMVRRVIDSYVERRSPMGRSANRRLEHRLERKIDERLLDRGLNVNRPIGGRHRGIEHARHAGHAGEDDAASRRGLLPRDDRARGREGLSET
jgi:hypothetical protein